MASPHLANGHVRLFLEDELKKYAIATVVTLVPIREALC
jgi:hypothetical protein